MKRYQESNWIVKLWRRRHYVYIPFKFISYKLRGGDDFPNNKTLWSVLVGVAQCDMKWTYTIEEVKESMYWTFPFKPKKKMTKEEISKVLRNNLKVVPKAYDMQGENFNSDCHMEITNKAYQILGEGDIDKGKNIVDEYLKETNGQL